MLLRKSSDTRRGERTFSGLICFTLALVLFGVGVHYGGKLLAAKTVSMSVPAAYASEEEGAPAATEGVEGETGEGVEAPPLDYWTPGPAPKLETKDYPIVKGFNSRISVWIVAQLHLFFAAFVLGVPLFVWVIEVIGFMSGDKRYDNMAHEFMKVAMTGFSLAASFGGLLSFMLVIFYPDFMKFMTGVFGSVMIYYALFFFAESFFVYTYYYGWDRMSSRQQKLLHIGLGLGLNLSGLVLMLLSNSWASFMMAPSGLDDSGMFLGDVWAAMNGHLWNPLNIHRFIANIAYGGSLTAAYAAFKLLTSKDPALRAHYDWMGYTSFIIAMVGLLPLPFAGYWLTKEIYDYSQQMGITLMGGAFAWLFIIQAVLIGAIFLSANYYLWCSLGRSDGAKRYTHMIQPIGVVIIIAFLMWFTPHTMVMTSLEMTQVGGTHHPILGYFGVMAAKNTAVNFLIITTFLSFQIFRRSSIRAVGDSFWAKSGSYVQAGIYAAGGINIISLGVYSYFLPASIRIGLSVPQVCTTAVVLIVCMLLDILIFREKEETGPVRWGSMPDRSQYALVVLAVSFTWLMGLMGYCRSALRQHWHVYTVFRDNSVDAFTPTLPFAANMVSLIVVIFMALVLFMFWMPILAAKKKEESAKEVTTNEA